MTTIVLIDDDATSIAIQKRYTKKFCGVDAVGFTDAEEAVKHLKTAKADLIVVDYSMPKMNGIELIQAVRAEGASQATPIVMVTSSSFESLRGKAMLAGAQGFVVKPLSAQDFKTRVLDHASTAVDTATPVEPEAALEAAH